MGLSREVCRCLSNLAANHASHASLMDSDAHVALVAAAGSPDALVARFATIGLLNLATRSENVDRLVLQAQCARCLVDLAGFPARSDRFYRIQRRLVF